MLRHLLVLVMGCTPLSHAFADGNAPFIGKWSGEYKTDEGFDREAELVVSAEGSTWTARPKGSAGKYNPCFGRAFPAVIEVDSPSGLSISILANSAVPVCKNSSVRLKLVDPTHLEGTIRGGRAVSLEKR
jgi:hypothetical protein